MTRPIGLHQITVMYEPPQFARITAAAGCNPTSRTSA